MSFTYPQPKREDLTEDYHGTNISDPYRWMEATNNPKELNV
jgi:prolyl oligopeptidase